MTHYICTGGCKGASDTPGTCQAKDCAKYGQNLDKCSCGDGNHEGRQEAKDPEKK